VEICSVKSFTIPGYSLNISMVKPQYEEMNALEDLLEGSQLYWWGREKFSEVVRTKVV